MELLSPSPPPHSPAICRGFDSPPPPREPDDGPAGIVHVAVGRSPEKTLALLRWTFRQFGCRRIKLVLVHVHQPSPLIPTLLGKLPATQANEQSVSAYRREERKETTEILRSYMNICSKAQVQANFIMTEAGNIQKGIVDLVTMHSIQKLVVGTTPENCFNVKGISRKASYTAKNAPAFCEIWFVSKGKHVWTREASKVSDSWLNNSVLGEIIRPISVPNENSECILDSVCFSASYITKAAWQRGGSMDLSESNNAELVMPTIASSISHGISQVNAQISTCSNSTGSWHTSPSERRISSDNNSWEKQELGGTYNRLEEVLMEVEESKTKGFAELVKRRKLEAAITETFNSVKACEAAYARETKFRDELEGLLKTMRMQQEELVHQRHEAVRELQNAMRKIDILTDQAREMAHRRDEAAGELELIQSSIETLQVERKKIQQHREESIRKFENWRSSHGTSPYCSKFVGFANDEFNFTEFTLSDLETGTCWFSESFKLGQGGYGTVYKGEMLNRTVVIKKLHPHNVQSEVEFQQEVRMLSKLRHPHLVTLIGVCSEALSLVYEYLPNGTLQDRLVSRTTMLPLNWTVRTRIAAEISSALLFLHSSKPEKIIHGDLKLGNIFLDSNYSCKIGDLGICRLVPEDTTRCPLFLHNTEPKGVFPYTDPEYQRTGFLTPKSDVYSFGIIILQLLTGKSPLGLANKVRRALLEGKLSSVLDTTAGGWPSDVATRFAEVGLQCSEVNCRDRPDLTPEIVRELKQLHTIEERPVPSFFLCPILQEIMHDPQVAADGFTYEGSALRGWLANGRQTSPMTNLKLDHLNLTPNHALRYAIQDWLCQPY